jgi:hypothetical protein
MGGGRPHSIQWVCKAEQRQTAPLHLNEDSASLLSEFHDRFFASSESISLENFESNRRLPPFLIEEQVVRRHVKFVCSEGCGHPDAAFQQALMKNRFSRHCACLLAVLPLALGANPDAAPASLADGDWPLPSTISGVQSPTGIVLSVRH